VKTRRPAVVAISIGAALAALLGVLGILHALAPDDEAIRAEFARALKEIEAMPDTDPIAKDRRIEDTLDVEDYKKYARNLWTKLDRLHGPVHQAKEAEVAARKVVPAFLDSCADLNGKTLDELHALAGKAAELRREYGATRYGPALNKLHDRLLEKIATLTPTCTDLDHFRLLQEIEKDRLAGRFASAIKRADEASAKHPACSDFGPKLRQKREDVAQSEAAAEEKVLKEAKKLRVDGRKDEAARSLEQALPNHAGFPAEGRMRALLKELRSP
jgi:hypothetical protein